MGELPADGRPSKAGLGQGPARSAAGNSGNSHLFIQETDVFKQEVRNILVTIKLVWWRSNDFVKTQWEDIYFKIQRKNGDGFTILPDLALLGLPLGHSNREQSRTNSQRALFKRFHPGLPTASASSFCHGSGTKTLKSGKDEGTVEGGSAVIAPTHLFGLPPEALTHPSPLLPPGVTLESWHQTY